ncbi:unnamed protein product [Microthlaspi erraticum]|uniref:Uncharacterized protein n=1 Tax=Microthlaspi erraticum TaxID=1685480 RepID=A0A6D2KL45_9BRAS|nr:unnamed protein product [Microthlaspi erraticum]
MDSKPSSAAKRVRPLGGSEPYRYYPQATGTDSGKEDVKQEVVRLGVSLSLYVAESMFLLCDDIGTMLSFSYKLWKYTLPPSDPVSQSLLRVIHYVYSNDIKPKKRVCQDGGNSVQWELIRTSWKDFTEGVIVLHRLVYILRRRDIIFDDRLLSSAIAKYKQVLKKLEDKLRSAKDVSEANGFARETIESNISHMWMSLFDEEADQGKATTEEMRNMILSDVFQPVLGKSWHSLIPTPPVYYPFILGKDFAKENMKEEVLGLGVELSLYVAESMFLLCDDVRSTLRFCLNIWRDYLNPDSYIWRDYHKPDGSLWGTLLRVMHYVYTIHIKPKKNGVYRIGGESVQWEFVRTTWESFDAGLRDMQFLIRFLRIRGGAVSDCREFTTRIEESMKKVEEKLRCAKDVSKANGFAREAMESNIADLWNYSLFNRETQESWTLEVIRDDMFSELFQPLLKEEEEAKQPLV